MVRKNKPKNPTPPTRQVPGYDPVEPATTNTSTQSARNANPGHSHGPSSSSQMANPARTNPQQSTGTTLSPCSTSTGYQFKGAKPAGNTANAPTPTGNTNNKNTSDPGSKASNNTSYGPNNVTLQSTSEKEAGQPVDDAAASELSKLTLSDMFPTCLDDDKPTVTATGATFQVSTNHFKAHIGQLPTLEKYDVSITGAHTVTRTEADGTQQQITPRLTKIKQRRILMTLLNQPPFNTTAASDYNDKIVSNVRLQTLVFTIDLLDENQTHRAQGDPPHNWTITLTHTGTLQTGELQHYRNSGTYGRGSEDILTALNLVASRFPSQGDNTSQHGANKDRFFSVQPTAGDELTGGLEVRFGFRRSIRNLQGGLMLQLSNSAAAFYCRVTLSSLLSNWLRSLEQANLQQGTTLNQGLYQHLDTANAFIRFLKVQKIYGGKDKHSVWGLAQDAAHHRLLTADSYSFKITTINGPVRRTLRQYLAERYQVTDLTEHALINVGDDQRPVYIPSDQLVVSPGNLHSQLLNSAQTRKMVRTAARSPRVNMTDITSRGVPMLGLNQQIPLRLVPNATLVQANARMLQNPILRYLDVTTDRRLVSEQRFTDAGPGPQALRRIQNRPLKQGVPTLENKHFWQVQNAPKCAWVFLYDNRPHNANDLGEWQKNILRGLRRYCSTQNQRPVLAPLNGWQRAQIPKGQWNNDDKLQTIFEDAKKQKVDILFVLLSSKQAAPYELVKRVADTKVGLQTICTVPGKGYRLKDSGDYIGNEMLKVNLKMGGINTSLAPEPGVAGLFTPETMIVGADVTHPGPGSMKDTESIAAVVATFESTFSQYPASIRAQTSRQELIDDIGNMFRERLDAWIRLGSPQTGPQRELPKQIIFFRDGVSEEQFYGLVQTELAQVQREVTKKYAAHGQELPKMLVLCVVKRVNTRFYANTQAHTSGNGNLHPGLVIDTGVVRARGRDFYLQSQMPIQGTGKPTHYVVISDTIGVPMNVLQEAIYHQCWTFPTSMVPVSVHPAARMADRACGRARAYLRDFYVPGSAGVRQSMDRQINANGAWRSGVHFDLRDSTFYV